MTALNTGADRSAPLVAQSIPEMAWKRFRMLPCAYERDERAIKISKKALKVALLLFIDYSMKKHIFTPATSISSLFLSACADEPISLLFTLGRPVLSPPSI